MSMLDQDFINYLSQKSMEISTLSSPVSNIRDKISAKNNDHETDHQHSTTEEDNDTIFEFKFDHHHHHHHQSTNSNSDSPDSPFKDSPADHIFRNGILLPHSFPVHYYNGSERRSFNYYQRSGSRTSSVGSKDSFITSRSNSTNSRSSTSSCSSSARTSVSDTTTNFDRKHLYTNAMKEYHKKRPQPAVLDHAYGSSRRWQFITPMPLMTQETISSRTKKQKLEPQGITDSSTVTKKVRTKKTTSASCSWPIVRFLRYLLTVCRECHALEPSVRSVSSIHEITRQ